ncbi:MAG TPA: hydrogenase 2 operon protein HybA [Bryobacteraceae bacterium]|nr:hydrogenase 2 operon protein HybA [Bryobacteraceae bacterium]
MNVTRRTLFKIAAAGCAGVTCLPHAGAVMLNEPTEKLGLLYDATRCIGCKACVTACSEANGLVPDAGSSDGMYQAPESLNAHTKNIIKLYRASDGHEWSYMKQQCMHCLDPACVIACPLSALTKSDFGIVQWNGTTCLGCRCCQIACPFNIPKFEWSQINPRVVKCELCRDRLALGKEPACTAVCPRQAVIFGKRSDLLDAAHRRIASNPGKYYQDRVYGEKDGGGTQSLYLSHVPFSKLGLPDLGDRSVASGVRDVQESIYQNGLTPALVYTTLVAVTTHFWREHTRHAAEEAEDLGLEEQL